MRLLEIVANGGSACGHSRQNDPGAVELVARSWHCLPWLGSSDEFSTAAGPLSKNKISRTSVERRVENKWISIAPDSGRGRVQQVRLPSQHHGVDPFRLIVVVRERKLPRHCCGVPCLACFFIHNASFCNRSSTFFNRNSSCFNIKSHHFSNRGRRPGCRSSSSSREIPWCRTPARYRLASEPRVQGKHFHSKSSLNSYSLRYLP